MLTNEERDRVFENDVARRVATLNDHPLMDFTLPDGEKYRGRMPLQYTVQEAGLFRDWDDPKQLRAGSALRYSRNSTPIDLHLNENGEWV